MPLPRPVTRLGLLLLASIAAACGLLDAFGTAGLEPVALTYIGDTVVTKDSTIPFGVIVTVRGTVMDQPMLAARTSDSTALALTPFGDSLRGLKLGKETLTVWLKSSIFTDSAPTISQVIRVRP